jgi:hypothetical protein
MPSFFASASAPFLSDTKKGLFRVLMMRSAVLAEDPDPDPDADADPDPSDAELPQAVAPRPMTTVAAASDSALHLFMTLL